MVQAEPLAVAVAEIKFKPDSAMEVSLGNVVIDAFDPALEIGKIAFNCVGVDSIAHVFIGTVIDRLVRSEIGTDATEYRRFIRHQIGFPRGVLFKDGSKVVGAHVGRMEGTNSSVPFDQRKHGIQMRWCCLG